jgi:CubicO group peptidase (beta-lactamase class C family)
MMRITTTALLISLIPAAWGQMGAAQEAAIEKVALAGISASRIPALSVAVATGDGPVWARAWGFADMENHVAATPRTVFRLASISKTFTAAAAMLLAEKGELSLDAEVQAYVPFPRKKWPVTTRQLLSHQAGIRHYNGSDFNSTHHYGGVMESLTIFALDPLEHEPGTKYMYSSYGFNLAGAVVERAAKRSFADYVRETILVPAGISSMRPDDVYAVIPFRARGYSLRKDGTLENCALADLSNKLPGGGWLATAGDLVLFARALSDGRIVSRQSLEAMWTPRKLANGETTGYGLGWAVTEVDGVKVVQHSGGQQGANTHLLIAPDKRITIAVMANLEGAGAPAIATAMLRALLKEQSQ